MNLKWLRRRNNTANTTSTTASSTTKHHHFDQAYDLNKEQQFREVIDIEHNLESQTASMSFNDEEYVKALTNEQIEDCQEAFAIFVDQDGFVDIMNLGSILRALGDKISDDEVQKITDQYDHTYFERGGKLNYEQFIELIVPRIIERSDTYNHVNIDTLFKEFDQDGDGYITAAELRKSLHKLGSTFALVADELTDEDVKDIIMECDEDGDGRISYSEFTGMIPHLESLTDEL